MQQLDRHSHRRPSQMSCVCRWHCDILSIKDSTSQIHSSSQCLEQYHEIEPNTAKSGILRIQLDYRGKQQNDTHFLGYPILQNYTYLGVEFNDKLECSIQKEKIKKTLKQQQIHLHNHTASRLPQIAKYYTWKSLLHSKVQYGNYLLLNRSK